MKNLPTHVMYSGSRYRSCSENCGSCTAQTVRCHSENGIRIPSLSSLIFESCSQNAPELSESSENGLVTPRAFCKVKVTVILKFQVQELKDRVNRIKTVNYGKA